MNPILSLLFNPVLAGATMGDGRPDSSPSDLKALTDMLAAEKAKRQAATAGSLGPQQPAPTAQPDPNNWGLASQPAAPGNYSWANSLAAPTSNGQPVTGSSLINKMMGILNDKADD